MTERSEREKMLAGELYDAADPELAALRLRARQLTRQYNQTREDEDDLRESLLREVFGATGERVSIEPPFYCDYGSNIYLGENFYMNFGGVILDCNIVRIGANVQCGPSVQLLAATHPLAAAERIAGPELAAPITIGDNVLAWRRRHRLPRRHHRREYHHWRGQRRHSRYPRQRLRRGQPLPCDPRAEGGWRRDIVFQNTRERRHSGWRFKPRLSGLAALRHKTCLRRFQRPVSPPDIPWGTVWAVRAGELRGRRPFRRGLNRPRASPLAPLPFRGGAGGRFWNQPPALSAPVSASCSRSR